ncbi:MAG: hypothetical protein B7733_15015 [Myxococcales bacterium FL481]|nr:MAG: hypothetical protein B7733_15015 [Myxococcales bacterium FL481]
MLIEGNLGTPVTPEICDFWYEENTKERYSVWSDAETVSGMISRIDPYNSGLPWLLILDANANIRVASPPPGLDHDELEAALSAVVARPLG